MIDQDSELATYVGRIVAAGCGYLNEENFVAEAVSSIVPFEVPRLKLENQDSAWPIVWRIASAWFWCGFRRVPNDTAGNSNGCAARDAQ